MSDAAEELIGVGMADVRAQLRAHARGTSPVLITGEHGTGKRIAARALHDLSERAAGPFIGLDCAVCTATLFETELAGRPGGRAIDRGRIEQAAGGTLRLWHVSELEPKAQQFLLRLLKERAFQRPSSNGVINADVRVVATTALPLPPLVKAGEFLSELAESLSQVQIAVPPLRERMSDFALLVNHFLTLHDMSITQEALDHLATMTWYENVSDVEDFLAPIVARSGFRTQLDAATIKSEPPLEPPVRLSREQQAAQDRAIAEEAVRNAGGDVRAAEKTLGVRSGRLRSMLSGD